MRKDRLFFSLLFFLFPCSLSFSSTLYLLRHGETDWSLEGRKQGWQQNSLNNHGKDQAKRVAKNLSQYEFSIIYTSPLCRAKETAEIIAKELNIPVVEDLNLREAHHGELEGTTYLDRPANMQKLVALHKSLSAKERFFHRSVPQAESRFDIWKRAYPALRKIAKKHQGENILIVTHGGLIKAVEIICTSDYEPKGLGECGLAKLDMNDFAYTTLHWTIDEDKLDKNRMEREVL